MKTEVKVERNRSPLQCQHERAHWLLGQDGSHSLRKEVLSLGSKAESYLFAEQSLGLMTLESVLRRANCNGPGRVILLPIICLRDWDDKIPSNAQLGASPTLLHSHRRRLAPEAACLARLQSWASSFLNC